MYFVIRAKFSGIAVHGFHLMVLTIERYARLVPAPYPRMTAEFPTAPTLMGV
jgi:hypothetical protein